MRAGTKPKLPTAAYVGVHVGSTRDRSAIAVAKPEFRPVEDRKETHFLVPHLEALPAGERYPDLARRVSQVCQGIRARSLKVWYIYVNSTGQGSSLADLIEEQLPSEKVIRVYFNHGDRRLRADGEVTFGKARLVDRIKMLLQAGRLHMPGSAEASTLVAELLDYEIKVDEKANERYGAFRVGTRDELVTALGLAVQIDLPDGNDIFVHADTWGPVREWHPAAKPVIIRRGGY